MRLNLKSITLTFIASLALALMPVPGAGAGSGPGARTAEAATMSIGASPQKVAEIGAIYQTATDTISKALADSLKSLDSTGVASAAYRAGRAAELLKNIQAATRRARVEGVKVVSPAVQSAFNRGASLAVQQAKELGLGGREVNTATSFAGINEQAVDAIASDTVAKINARTAQHGENAVGLFRSLSTAMAGIDARGVLRGFSLSERDVNRVIAQGIVSGDPREAMGLMRKLIGTGAGFDASVIENYRKVGNQIIGVGAWSGTVRTYAEMVVRTRTAEAQREGQIERQVSLGLDLAQITGSNSDNFCTRFVGLVVVVRGGARDGYVALESLPGGGPPFHPNCTKNLAAFVPDLVSEGRVEQADKARVVYERAAANGTLLDPITRRRAA